MRFTDAELGELNIRRIDATRKDGSEYTAYEYKCDKCGRPTLRRSIILKTPVICALCKTDAIQKKKAVAEAVEREAKELEKLMGLYPEHDDRFSKAAKKARTVVECEKAILEAAKDAHKYASMPEALAAILLISCGMEIVPQAKIFKDSKMAVDFMLPDFRVVVEIDGELYHTSEDERETRDYSIKNALGKGWTVLHIPAGALAKDPSAFRRFMLRRFVNAS